MQALSHAGAPVRLLQHGQGMHPKHPSCPMPAEFAGLSAEWRQQQFKDLDLPAMEAAVAR